MHRICNHFANYISIRILDRQPTCIVHAIFIDQTRPPQCARPPQYVSSTQMCLARSNSIVHMRPLSLSRAETKNGLQPVPVISSFLVLSPRTRHSFQCGSILSRLSENQLFPPARPHGRQLSLVYESLPHPRLSFPFPSFPLTASATISLAGTTAHSFLYFKSSNLRSQQVLSLRKNNPIVCNEHSCPTQIKQYQYTEPYIATFHRRLQVY
jgi:hypothetical protein